MISSRYDPLVTGKGLLEREGELGGVGALRNVLAIFHVGEKFQKLEDANDGFEDRDYVIQKYELHLTGHEAMRKPRERHYRTVHNRSEDDRWLNF